MNSRCCSNETVKYTSPAHGGWGVVRLGMLVPESYQLFVCPFACGRHGAIGAIKQKLKERLSYLYIEEADIVSGSYENLIPDAVDELFSVLEHRPKVLMIFVSCLDDLLGTDHGAIEDILHDRYPDTMFTFCHMNPITQDGKNPPPVNIRRKMYGLIKPQQETEPAVNLLGNPVPVAESSELYEILKLAGIEKVNHIANCRTFEQFQALGKARLNIVTASPGLRAAEDMKKRLGIDYLYLPVSYDIARIAAGYHELLDKLQCEQTVDLQVYQARALERLNQVLDLVRHPLVLDYTAISNVFDGVLALLQYGFSVTQILAPEPKGAEKAVLAEILEKQPDIRMCYPQHHNVPALWGAQPECVAIGYEAAYITGSRYIVNLVNDEELFGYDGICRLMDLVAEGLSSEQDLQEIINNYGLVI